MQSDVLPFTMYDSMGYESVNSQPPPSGFQHREAIPPGNQQQPQRDLPPLHPPPAQGATGGGGGTAVKQAPQEDIQLDFEDLSAGKKDISNYKTISDFFYIFIGVLVVEVLVIFLVRYNPELFGTVLNRWYDLFGLNAVIADILIIVIGFVIGRYVYTSYVKPKFAEGKWSPLYFTGTLVAVQLIHDLLFYFGIIKQIPRGHNTMMDTFKDYAESAGWKILAGDAGLMIASSLLSMELKASAGHVVTSVGLVALYALPYILYTKHA